MLPKAILPGAKAVPILGSSRHATRRATAPPEAESHEPELSPNTPRIFPLLAGLKTKLCETRFLPTPRGVNRWCGWRELAPAGSTGLKSFSTASDIWMRRSSPTRAEADPSAKIAPQWSQPNRCGPTRLYPSQGPGGSRALGLASALRRCWLIHTIQKRREATSARYRRHVASWC